MEEPWRIELFGGLRARRGGREVSHFATSRVAALLARLALFPHRTHPREELSDLLWPESDLDAGRLSLRVALASLRKHLETPGTPAGSVLDADRSAVRFQPYACRTDVGDFEAALQAAERAPTAARRREALDEALGLFRGELLPGFYDEWIVEERERLNALHEEAQSRRLALPPDPLPEMRGFPPPFTRFFGRETECARIVHWLGDAQTRLVTLTGPGGIGKTRLADTAARSARASFPGPVCLVPLADLSQPDALPDAIAQALGLPRTPTGKPLDQVIAALSASPPALLVLDNFEHLVERAAPLLHSLLTRLPTLTCLVTSRRRLGLPGERQFPVAPLELPDASALFVDRAQATRPDFQITPGNAEDVATLCRRLEGLPLAIELVAARAQSLTPAQMNERLAHRFELLTSRRGDKNWDKNGRHRSLWAAIAWSHDLLPPGLQRFFLALSVFRGGCAPEAAAFVCGEPGALEMLTQLRERSLAAAEEAGADMRFRLLESLREFGEEQLSDDERAALARSHAAHFLGRAEETYPLLFGPAQARWLDRLEADHENLRRALDWWLSDPTGVDEGLRLSAALWRFWAVRGHYAAGRAWLGRALAREGGTPALRAKAANAGGNLARAQGEYAEAERLFRAALTTMRGAGHPVAVGSLLCNLGMVAMHREDYAGAVGLYEESLALRREAGDQAGTAFSLQCLGLVAQHQREHARARALFGQSLALWDELEDEGGRTWARGSLAALALETGAYAEAQGLYPEVLRRVLALGDQEALTFTLAAFSRLVLRGGRADQAATLLGASDALLGRTGLQPPPQNAADLAALLSDVRAALPGAEFTAAWAAGRAMTGEEAAAYALAG